MAQAYRLGKPRQKPAGTLKRGNHISAEGELRYRVISDKEHPTVQRRLAEIHLAKIGKLDRGEQLVVGIAGGSDRRSSRLNTHPPTSFITARFSYLRSPRHSAIHHGGVCLPNSTPSIR